MACATGPLRLVINPEELLSKELKVIPMQLQAQEQVPKQELHSPATAGRERRSPHGWLAGIALILVFAGLLASGILQRIHTDASLRTETADLAVPSVSIIAPKRAAPSQEIVLPGNVQPFIASPILPALMVIWSIGISISGRT